MDFADGVAGLGVGGARYGAGVDDDDARSCGVGSGGESAVEQLTLDGGSIGLSGAAAELLDVESGQELHLGARAGEKAEGGGVHAVAEAGGLGAVGEEVAEVGFAEGALYFLADDAAGGICFLVDVFFGDGSPEA